MVCPLCQGSMRHEELTAETVCVFQSSGDGEGHAKELTGFCALGMARKGKLPKAAAALCIELGGNATLLFYHSEEGDEDYSVRHIFGALLRVNFRSACAGKASLCGEESTRFLKVPTAAIELP
eukprot:1136864-Pelagomonas_calceolata.AAC.20